MFHEICCSVTQSCLTLCDPRLFAALLAPLSTTISQSLLKLMSTEQMMPSKHLILCLPLLLLLSVFPSIGAFTIELALHFGWPKNCSFSISSSNKDWLVWSCCPRDSQESSLAPHLESVFQLSALFMVQLSHLYMTTEKTIALTIWTFVGKAMSLLWNMLCRFVIVFLPRSKCLLISWR